jgi:hypothetical protein
MFDIRYLFCLYTCLCFISEVAISHIHVEKLPTSPVFTPCAKSSQNFCISAGVGENVISDACTAASESVATAREDVLACVVLEGSGTCARRVVGERIKATSLNNALRITKTNVNINGKINLYYPSVSVSIAPT